MLNRFIGKTNFISQRTSTIQKSIFYITIFKGGNILLSFLLIPVTINFVNPSQYGVWLTLSSIISWMSIFDVGLGNGLRNKLTESLARKDVRGAKEYVSTTYFALTLLSFIIFIIGIISCIFVDWNSLLKLNDQSNNLLIVVIYLILGFCLRFVFQTISVVLFSFQKPQISEIILFFGNLISLSLIYFFKFFFEAKLLFLVFALSYPPILVMIIGSIIFFRNTKYRFAAPDIKFFRKNKVDSLLNLGIKFFILQISVLITYSISNFIILRLLDSTEVTKYNIAFKYFSILTILISIVSMPLWSAFTDAYEKADIEWIKKMLYIWLIILAISIGMLIISHWFYYRWTGLDLKIPFSLSLVMCLYMLVCCWNAIFVSFINGVGKVKLQMYISIIPIFFMIPLSYLLVVKFHFGVTGVAASMFIFNFVSSFILTFQSYLILNKKDKGIWSK